MEEELILVVMTIAVIPVVIVRVVAADLVREVHSSAVVVAVQTVVIAIETLVTERTVEISTIAGIVDVLTHVTVGAIEVLKEEEEVDHRHHLIVGAVEPLHLAEQQLLQEVGEMGGFVGIVISECAMIAAIAIVIVATHLLVVPVVTAVLTGVGKMKTTTISAAE